MWRSRGLVGMSALLAVLASACSPVTQLLVVVRSDLPPEDIAEVHIAVVPGEPFTSTPSTRQARIGAGEGRVALPFSFGVLPRGGDASSRVEITVSAIDAAGATRVTRTVRTGFSAGRTLAVPIFLAASCRERSCEPGLTCVDGACVSSDVPIGDLVPVRPGEEFMDAPRLDAGTPPGSDAFVPPGTDAGLPSSVGLPPPTRHTWTPVGEYAFVRAIVPVPDGDVLVLVDTSELPVFELPSTLRSGPTTSVVRLGADLAPRWSYTIEGSVYATSAALSGDRMFVCGSFDGTMRPDDRAPVSSTSDGVDDYNDAAFVLELDAASGAARAIHTLEAGRDVYCNDVAVSGSTLGLALSVSDASEIRFDAAPLALDGCALPDGALVRLALGGGGIAPSSALTFNQTSGLGTRALSDGAGGFFVALSSVQSGQENANRICGAGGPPLSAELLRVDASGDIAWARTLLEVPELAATSMSQTLAVSGDRVVIVADVDTQDLPFTVLGNFTTVSPNSGDPRLIRVSVRTRDGNDPRFAAAVGSIRSSGLAGREPDVALCGQTPFEGLRAGFRSDLFGMAVPTTAATGFVVSLDPDGRARWGELAIGDQGAVTACASDGAGGLFVSPTFLNLTGTFRGESFMGSAIVHLQP